MSLNVSILVGLPGAGKSTFSRARFGSEVVHISKDNFANHRRPSVRQAILLREALGSGRSVVVDNTNVSVRDRATIIEIAREFGAVVTGYVFETAIAECRERNARRTGKACVPLVAIYTAAKKWEKPEPEEGFDALYTVRVADGEFDVAPYSGS